MATQYQPPLTITIRFILLGKYISPVSLTASYDFSFIKDIATTMDRACNVFHAAYDMKPFGQTVDGCSFGSKVHASTEEGGRFVNYSDPVKVQSNSGPSPTQHARHNETPNRRSYPLYRAVEVYRVVRCGGCHIVWTAGSQTAARLSALLTGRALFHRNIKFLFLVLIYVRG
jgi:hypothetical protein